MTEPGCRCCGGRIIWWTFDEEIPPWRLCEECDLPEGAFLGEGI